MEYCACGCGGLLDFRTGRKNKKFLKGHAIRLENKAAEARRGEKPWNFGIERTEIEKETISLAIKNAKANSDYVYTDEHKQRISEALKKVKKTTEWVDKIVKSRENNPNYENSKKQISETLKQKYLDGELTSPFYIDGRYKNDPNSDFNLYGGEFTIELKKIIRLRDNYTCQICGKKRSTTVHHIDYNKLNNIENNLITLCQSCHARHHHKGNLKFLAERELFTNKIKNYYEQKQNCSDL